MELNSQRKQNDVRVRRRIIYEAHVRGTTMLNFNLPAELRGKYLGMSHPLMIAHLKKLKVTTVQLMPVFASKGTYWGYDPVSWTELNPLYGTLEEFKQMISEFHKNGIEVILDVVYNHTAPPDNECSNPRWITKNEGPIKGVKYYNWDVTGCGNTVNVKESLPVIMESIDYWLRDIGVDGMRFDLANVLGREGGDFNINAEFFKLMEQYSDKILIAEPWDCSEYSLGRYPNNWLELNGKFRDATRQGYQYKEGTHLPVHRGVNFVTCHDGFTLEDLVSYNNKHNHSNGENNRDGCNNNNSYNFGVEGQTRDHNIKHARTVHKYWLNKQMMDSKGHVLILAGDELGNTQFGNNNSYCQDNPLGWVTGWSSQS